MNNYKIVLDTKRGNITSKTRTDIVTLYGIKQNSDSDFVEQVEFELYTSYGNIIKQQIPDSGYNLQLFIGDFTGDGLEDIMVRGEFGGSGGYAIARIYMYTEGKLIEIFYQDMINEIASCKATYLIDNKIKIDCNESVTSYIGDFYENNHYYHDMIYTREGSIKPDQSPTISELNAAFPIQPTDQSFYDLLLMQRVVGVSNSDNLGVIQTWISLYDGKMEVRTQGFYKKFTYS